MTRSVALLLALLLATGCPSEPEDPKDTGPDTSPRDEDLDGYFDDEDCDDSDPDVHPGAEEVCNEADDDCDEQVDEDVTDSFYQDADEDGYGDEEQAVQACDRPDGYVPFGNDCDDGDSDVHPGATEECDDVDNNCDGETDEGLLSVWYSDVDGDGYGDPEQYLSDCEDIQPTGMVENDEDCDDSDAAVNPEATESCNGVDDDCDGETDEGDSSDATRYYEDADGDGHGDLASWLTACSQPSGYVGAADADDCDDADSSIHPDADEYCNSADDDCDGLSDESDAVDADTWYEDGDGDGFGDAAVTTTACSQPAGYTDDYTDCDDVDAEIFPGADEYCNGDDDDCDGTVDEDDALDVSTWYYDDDGDGYGDDSITSEACSVVRDHVSTGGDCDDTDSGVNPGAAELCDLVDQDCDGAVDDGALGTAEDCPAEDCTAVLADNAGAADGSYYMSDGYWWTCEMSTDGGGWLEVSTAVQVWGTGYDTQYHNTAGFSWSEVLFRYDSGSSTADCTYPTSIPSSNPISFQFGSEDWGLPDGSCGSTCSMATTDYASSTSYLTSAYDFVVARSESSDTIRVGMLEGVAYCTTSDNWGYAWVDILIRR